MRANFRAVITTLGFRFLTLIFILLLLQRSLSSQNPVPPSLESGESSRSTADQLRGNFFARFFQAYSRELRGKGETGPEPPSRIPPPPLSSPPFPNAYW